MTDTTTNSDPMSAAREQLGDQSAATGLDADRPAFGLEESSESTEPVEHAEPAAEAEPSEPTEQVESADPDEAAGTPQISPYDRPGKWFVVHTQSGYEKKVKQNLEARISVLGLEEKIHEIEVPMEDVIEFKNGRKVVVKKKLFPGYLLVRCENAETVHIDIRETPGVTGYAGPGGRPAPLRRREVESFLATPEPGEDSQRRTKPSIIYEIDENVRIKDGPFSDFQGQVVEVNEEHLRVKVLVNIFGRETPVELEFAQVSKI